MNNGNNHLCPGCGETKCQNGKFICRTCFERWQIDSGKSIAQCGEPIPMPVWVEPRAESILTGVRRKLKEVRVGYENLQQEVADSAYKKLTEKLENRQVSRGEFLIALDTIKQELWKDRGGNSLYRELKVLQETSNCLRIIIQNLEKKKAEYEKAQVSNAGSPQSPEEEHEQQINEGYQRVTRENSPPQEIPKQEELEAVEVPVPDKPVEVKKTN